MIEIWEGKTHPQQEREGEKKLTSAMERIEVGPKSR